MRRCLVTAIIFFGLIAFSYADVVNGDFSNGLDGWTAAGNTKPISGAAVLSDSGDSYSSLYQGVALIPGTYSLDFDFENSLSNIISSDDDFVFPDSFYATLYFADDLSAFSTAFNSSNSGILGPALPGLALFDLDSNGPRVYSGTIGSMKNPEWFHFDATFNMNFEGQTYAYAIPMFELFDGNYVDGDSTVSIDNVSIAPTAVPEPGTLISLALGLTGLILTGKIKLLR